MHGQAYVPHLELPGCPCLILRHKRLVIISSPELPPLSMCRMRACRAPSGGCSRNRATAFSEGGRYKLSGALVTAPERHSTADLVQKTCKKRAKGVVQGSLVPPPRGVGSKRPERG